MYTPHSFLLRNLHHSYAPCFLATLMITITITYERCLHIPFARAALYIICILRSPRCLFYHLR